MLKALGFGGSSSKRTTAETLGWLQLPSNKDEKAVVAVLNKTEVDKLRIEAEADAEIIVDILMGCSERFGQSQLVQRTVFDVLNRGTRATQGALVGKGDLENRMLYLKTVLSDWMADAAVMLEVFRFLDALYVWVQPGPMAVLDADFIGIAGAVLTMHGRRDEVQACVLAYLGGAIKAAGYEPEVEDSIKSIAPAIIGTLRQRMAEASEEHAHLVIACIGILNVLFERLPEAIEECALDALDAVHNAMLKHRGNIELIRHGVAFLEYSCVDDARMIVISSGCDRNFGFISDFLKVFAEVNDIATITSLLILTKRAVNPKVRDFAIDACVGLSDGICSAVTAVRAMVDDHINTTTMESSTHEREFEEVLILCDSILSVLDSSYDPPSSLVYASSSHGKFPHHSVDTGVRSIKEGGLFLGRLGDREAGASESAATASTTAPIDASTGAAAGKSEAEKKAARKKKKKDKKKASNNAADTDAAPDSPMIESELSPDRGQRDDEDEATPAGEAEEAEAEREKGILSMLMEAAEESRLDASVVTEDSPAQNDDSAEVTIGAVELETSEPDDAVKSEASETISAESTAEPMGGVDNVPEDRGDVATSIQSEDVDPDASAASTAAAVESTSLLDQLEAVHQEEEQANKNDESEDEKKQSKSPEQAPSTPSERLQRIMKSFSGTLKAENFAISSESPVKGASEDAVMVKNSDESVTVINKAIESSDAEAVSDNNSHAECDARSSQEILQLNEEISRLRSEVTNLSSSLRAVTEERDGLRQSLEVANNKTASSSHTSNSTSSDASKEELLTQKTTIADQSAEIASLKAQVADLQASLSDHIDAKKSLFESLQLMADQMQELKLQQHDAEERLLESEKRRAEAEASIDNMQKLLEISTQSQEQATAAAQKFEEVNDLLQRATKRIENLMVEMAQTRLELEDALRREAVLIEQQDELVSICQESNADARLAEDRALAAEAEAQHGAAMTPPSSSSRTDTNNKDTESPVSSGRRAGRADAKKALGTVEQGIVEGLLTIGYPIIDLLENVIEHKEGPVAGETLTYADLIKACAMIISEYFENLLMSKYCDGAPPDNRVIRKGSFCRALSSVDAGFVDNRRIFRHDVEFVFKEQRHVDVLPVFGVAYLLTLCVHKKYTHKSAIKCSETLRVLFKAVQGLNTHLKSVLKPTNGGTSPQSLKDKLRSNSVTRGSPSDVPTPTEAEVLGVYKLLQKFSNTLAIIFEAYPSTSTEVCRYDTSPGASFPAIVDQAAASSSGELGMKLPGQPIRNRTLVAVQQMIKDLRISPQLVDGGTSLSLIAESMRVSGVDFASNFHDSNMTVSFYQFLLFLGQVAIYNHLFDSQRGFASARDRVIAMLWWLEDSGMAWKLNVRGRTSGSALFPTLRTHLQQHPELLMAMNLAIKSAAETGTLR